MKKRFAAVLAATAVLGVTSAFAANPFSDVTPSDWAYQSVAQLANAGVINGYPDGTFKGENNITRYEVAQMVAKAMANQHRVDAEQQALINRLADEFSEELNNLGVRVSNLEKRVGNVKVTGDARLRFRGAEENGVVQTNSKSKFDYRARLVFNASVNDKTSAVVRVTTGNTEFGNATGTSAKFDRAFVSHKFGDYAKLQAGRYGEFLGTGLVYDGAFDGAKLTIGNDKLSASVAYGYFVEGGLFHTNHGAVGSVSTYDFSALSASSNYEALSLELKAKLGDKVSVGGFYTDFQDIVDESIYGFNLGVKANKFWVGGEWVTADKAANSDAWIAGVDYGNYAIAKAGTWHLSAHYMDFDVNSPIIYTTYNVGYDTDYKGFMVSGDYAIGKNVGLGFNYMFAGEDQAGADIPDFYRVHANYKF